MRLALWICRSQKIVDGYSKATDDTHSLHLTFCLILTAKVNLQVRVEHMQYHDQLII